MLKIRQVLIRSLKAVTEELEVLNILIKIYIYFKQQQTKVKLIVLNKLLNSGKLKLSKIQSL